MTKVLYVEHDDDNLYMLKMRLEPVPGREALDEVLVAAAVGGVEGDDGDVQPRPGQLADDDLVGPAGGQHDRPGRGRQQLRDDGAADVAAAAQQDDGLRFAERVLHGFSGSVVEES